MGLILLLRIPWVLQYILPVCSRLTRVQMSAEQQRSQGSDYFILLPIWGSLLDAWSVETMEKEKGTQKSYSNHSQLPPSPSCFLLMLPSSIRLSNCFLWQAVRGFTALIFNWFIGWLITSLMPWENSRDRTSQKLTGGIGAQPAELA